jgi:hypothetical protein
MLQPSPHKLLPPQPEVVATRETLFFPEILAAKAGIGMNRSQDRGAQPSLAE